MSKDQLLKKAHNKHMQGKHDAAVRLYNEVLRISPNHLDANYLLGTLYAETGDFTLARQHLEKADSINPTSPYIKINLGNICMALGNYAEAKEFFHHALALKNDLPQAYFGLGTILETVDGDMDGAEQQYRKVLQHFQTALQNSPNDPALLQGIGRSLFKAGKSLALECFQRAILINPRLPGISWDYGIACVRFGRNADAVRYLRQALLLNQEDTEVRYYLSIAEGKTPDKALQQEYVRNQFDQFAEGFDKMLVEKLEYTIPEKMIGFLAETFPEGFHFKSAADLGCGTGLLGPALRTHVDYLAGIDISSRMIELAKTRNCYDTLLEGEVITTLHDSEATYDLFAATDVLIYFGALDELFATLPGKARPEALFVFSTESYEGDGFIIRGTGRYAHSRRYIQSVVEQSGGSILADKQVKLRKDIGEWITGDLYIVRLHSGSNSDT